MIYATLESLQPGKYNPVRRGAMAAALALAAAVSAQPRGPWRDAPAFVSLFAPVGPRAAAYRAYVSELDLEEALKLVRADAAGSRMEGSWAPQPQLPLDAFGRAGPFDRGRVARLYGSRRPIVARGIRTDDDGRVEAWTLISPYPDASLERLESGTLLLVLRVE